MLRLLLAQGKAAVIQETHSSPIGNQQAFETANQFWADLAAKVANRDGAWELGLGGRGGGFSLAKCCFKSTHRKALNYCHACPAKYTAASIPCPPHTYPATHQ
jgi:hypothetical protein